MQNVEIGAVRAQGSLKVIGNAIIRLSAYDFLFNFNSVILCLCLSVLVELRLVTDGQTDTDRHTPGLS